MKNNYIKIILSLTLGLTVYSFTSSPVFAGPVADHTSVSQFPSIPKTKIDQAGAIKTLFMHQSTGNNIDFLGLQCLSGGHGDPSVYPPECITYANNYPNGWPLYPNQWSWDGWPVPMADGKSKTDQFVSIVNSRQSNFDVIGMKFCYVDAWDQDFDYYKTKMEQLQIAYPTKKFIWATQVLYGEVANGDTCYTGGWFNSCESIQSFNDQLRAYSKTHNIYLYDMADIESDGGRCYINGYRRYEILCPEYYNGYGGGGGGHPDTDGSIRLAKGFWWLMVNLGSTSPAPTPTTSPACSSDINHDHTVNQSDLLLILQNFNSNISSYDINSDGKVNMQDAVYVIKNWGGSC